MLTLTYLCCVCAPSYVCVRACACSLPNSTFVVQDLPEVMPIAKANIERRAPEAAKIGRISNEPHNFFDLQPRYGEGYVYLLRYILCVCVTQ